MTTRTVAHDGGGEHGRSGGGDVDEPVIPLERRYRAVLRVLPEAYRRAWGDDMTAAFLDGMRTGDPDQDEYLAEYGRPGWDEVGSVLALAVRLRLDALRGRLDGGRRGVAWGAAVRFAVLGALLMQAAGAAAGMATALWVAGRIPGLPAAPAAWSAAGAPGGFWHHVGTFAGPFWLASFLALVLGYPRVARVLIGAALVPLVLTAAVATSDELAGARLFLVTIWVDVLLGGALLLGSAALPEDAPRSRPGPWLGAFLAGTAGFVAAQVLAPAGGRLSVLDWPGLCALAFVAAAAVGLATRRGAGGLALLGAAVVALRVLTVPDLAAAAPPDQRGQLLAAVLAEVAGVLALGVPLAARAARELRQISRVAAVPGRIVDRRG